MWIVRFECGWGELGWGLARFELESMVARLVGEMFKASLAEGTAKEETVCLRRADMLTWTRRFSLRMWEAMLKI